MTPTATTPPPDDSRGSIAARNERGADRGAESAPWTEPDDSRGSIAARNERGADRGAESGPWTEPEAPGVDDDALRRCADEPIAVPGAVQPHGALLAVTEEDLAVVVASANAPDLFGRPVAGSTLAQLLADDDTARLRAGLAGDLAEVNPLRMRLPGGEVDLVLSRADGLLITEWERVEGAEQAGAVWHRRLP